MHYLVVYKTFVYFYSIQLQLTIGTVNLLPVSERRVTIMVTMYDVLNLVHVPTAVLVSSLAPLPAALAHVSKTHQ